MGRKSKLSPEQWASIAQRVIDGESISDLGREYGLGESTIRSHIERSGQKSSTVQQVAQMINDTRGALQSLTPPQRAAAVSIAERMSNIQDAVLTGAELAAKSFLRCSAIANSELQKVNDAAPSCEVSMQAARNADAYTSLGNKCLQPVTLLTAKNEQLRRAMEEEGATTVEEEMTPERIKEGARRMAFALRRAATLENN